MGLDITMSIVKNGKYLRKDIFNGRNSEWFRNLMQEGDEIYDKLIINYDIPDAAPDDYKENYTKENCFWGQRWFYAGAFKEWYMKYRPDRDAGWTTKYQAWLYENRNETPEYLAKELYSDDIIEDRVFIEVINKYDCSRWLCEYLAQNNIPNDAIVVYCFDN